MKNTHTNDARSFQVHSNKSHTKELKIILQNSKHFMCIFFEADSRKVSGFPFGIVIPKSESKEKRRGQTYLKTISSPSEIKKEIVPGIPSFEIQNYSPI